jgi:hypothetical protein
VSTALIMQRFIFLLSEQIKLDKFICSRNPHCSAFLLIKRQKCGLILCCLDVNKKQVRESNSDTADEVDIMLPSSFYRDEGFIRGDMLDF